MSETAPDAHEVASTEPRRTCSKCSPAANGIASTTSYIVPFASAAAYVTEHWKGVLIAATLVAVFIPRLYGVFVGLLPKAYYQLGMLGDPPNFASLPAWDVDLNWVDGAPESRQLSRVLTASGTIARLRKDDYKPGRVGPSGTSPEIWGKQWTSGQCLFISSLDLVLVDISHRPAMVRGTPGTREFAAPFSSKAGDDTSYVSAPVSRVQRDAGGKDLTTYFLSRLPRSVKDTACLRWDPHNGPACTRIAIWARGTPAPCFISFF